MAKAKYVVINCDEMLPIGGFTSQKGSNEAGEASGAEKWDVVSSAEDLQKSYKAAEILRLHNSVQPAESAVKTLGTKPKAAKATFNAMANHDYTIAPEAKEGEAKKAGRKNTSRKLDNAILSIRHDGFNVMTSGSIRRIVFDTLEKFQGNKKSVAYKDFFAVLDPEVQMKVSPAIRHLARFGHVDVQIEVEGDLVQWLEIDEVYKAKFEERQAKKAEAKAAKAATKKAKKATKKAKKD